MSEDGTVEDWDAAQKLWEFTIKSRLIAPSQRDPMRNGLNETPKEEDGEKQEGQAMDIDGVDESEVFLAENPLLMTEPAWNSVKNREKSIEIAMESWGAPAFWIQRSGVLAAFASGKPSALVVDVGARSTSITPVHDGMILRKGALHSPLAGDFISSQLRLQFASNKPAPITFTPSYLVAHKVPVEAGQPALASYRSFSPESAAPHPSFRRLQEEKVLHEFKESVVEVWNKGGLFNSSSAGMSNEERATGEIARPFEFPDGFNQVFTSDAFKAAEGLFDPRSAFTDDTNPAPDAKRALPAMIQQSLNAVDIDTRPYLMANVVVVGGGSLVRGFTDRLNQELGALYPAPKLRLHAAGNLYERRFASWIGGSILASLGTFHQVSFFYFELGLFLLWRLYSTLLHITRANNVLSTDVDFQERVRRNRTLHRGKALQMKFLSPSTRNPSPSLSLA